MTLPSSWNDQRLLATLERAFEHHAGGDNAIDLEDLKRALGIRSDYLARRMLASFDLDANGIIDRNEFLNGVRALIFGDEKTKLHFAFRLNDQDGDGFIDKMELMRMIGISMSEAETYRASQPPDELTWALFTKADRDNDGKISFAEFEACVRERPDLLHKMTHSEAIWIAPNEELIALLDARGSTKEETDWAGVALVAVWMLLNVGVFVASFLMAPEGANASYEAGRAFGRCIDMNGALILVPMMRRVLTWVRTTWLGRVFPIDEAIDFHKILGHGLFALACAHSISFGLAYASGHGNLLQIFSTNRGVTGVALLGVFAIMWLFALPFIRRSKRFELFYFTHLLYVPWLVLAIVHARPFAWIAGVPIGVFMIEQLLRWLRRGPACNVIDKRALRSGVTYLEVQKPKGFESSPGDYVFLRIPEIAPHEWHPFTISSAPERDVLSFHVRSLGNWTSVLRRVVETSPATPMRAFIDGPYGTPSGEIFEARHVVLIGAGIGVTPFASVLESLVMRAYGHGTKRSSKLERVHFFWLNKDQYSFEWFVHLLAELERIDERRMLEIHLCMTSGRSGATAIGLELARDAMQEAGRGDLVTGLRRTKTHMGQPDWEAMLGTIVKTHAPHKVDVFFCGPHGLGNKIKPICAKLGMRFREEKF